MMSAISNLRKYELPMRVVVQPEGVAALDGATLKEPFTEHGGGSVNSGPYNGLGVDDAMWRWRRMRRRRNLVSAKRRSG